MILSLSRRCVVPHFLGNPSYRHRFHFDTRPNNNLRRTPSSFLIEIERQRSLTTLLSSQVNLSTQTTQSHAPNTLVQARLNAKQGLAWEEQTLLSIRSHLVSALTSSNSRAFNSKENTFQKGTYMDGPQGRSRVKVACGRRDALVLPANASRTFVIRNLGGTYVIDRL